MQRGVPSLPPQPVRVAGPRQRIPSSMRHRISFNGRPTVNSGAWRLRFSVETAFFSRITGQSSQTLLVGSENAFPVRRAVSASATISGVEGQPGRLTSTGTTSLIA